MQKKLNIAMAGGGTGGHVLPIKSLIQHILEQEQTTKQVEKVFWYGSKKSFEEESCKELIHTYDSDKIEFISIFSGKYRRQKTLKALLENIIDMFLFLIGVFQGIFFLYKHNIDIIFCKGGYVALPISIAGFLMKKKIIVHESDVKPGLVNKISSKFAKKVFTGFDNVLDKSETVGQILSDEIVFNPIQDKYQIIKEPNSKKTRILLVGGSQGAKSLYQTFIDTFKKIGPDINNFELFVILGKQNMSLRKDFQQLENTTILDFVSQKEMGELLYFCDIAITRAGTTSLAEQKLYNLKLIMVPIPWTHDQFDNATYYKEKYSDILLDSTSKNYNTDFKKALLENTKFKKIHTSHDISKDISEIKDTVISEILT